MYFTLDELVFPVGENNVKKLMQTHAAHQITRVTWPLNVGIASTLVIKPKKRKQLENI